MTRAEFFRTSSAWASTLIRAGCGREIPVAVILPRGLDALTGIFAVLEAGGAYVPISYSDPVDRMQAILADCGASIVITTDQIAGKLGSFSGTKLTLSDFKANSSGSTAPLPEAGVHDLAYIFYTSGTTGEPKGVEGTHEQLINYALWCKEAFAHRSGEVTFLSASLFFLGSLTTIFTPLLMGWPILVAPDGASTDALHRLSRTVQGGLLKLTPTHIRMMMARGVPETGLARQLMVGSEPLRFTPQLREWMAADPRRVVVNHYGLTETHGCFCHWLSGSEEIGSRVPIGKPIDNVVAVIVDRDCTPVREGEIGELLIGGPSVGRGYRRRPGLTADRWLPDAWGAGSRLLRTGDLARLGPDGAVTVLGRADRQVKIRGHRVEPAAVEDVLRRSNGIKEALVLPRDVGGTMALDAYLLAEEESVVDLVSVKADLESRLPPPSIPGRMAVLTEFPVNANGKVDAGALPVPQPVGAVRQADSPAGRWSITELLVGGAYCEVLRIGEIDRTDDFYELGGDSLTAVEVAARIGRTLGRDVAAPAIAGASVQAYARSIGSAHHAVPADRFPRGEDQALPARERLRFNPAQERNLHNWPEDEWRTKTLPVVVVLNEPSTVGEVLRAIDRLVGRHGALRSRVVHDDDGVANQEIVSPFVRLPVRQVDAADDPEVWAHTPVDPRHGAADVTLYLRDGAVTVVRLTVSHVFIDALGAQVLGRELRLLVEGKSLSYPAAQPTAFAGAGIREEVARNTEHWTKLLLDAPRACTYSGVAREPRESVRTATVRLSETMMERIDEGSRLLGVTPYVLWVAAVSTLVGRLTGTHHHVFRSTYANRFTVAEFGAVAQLAQAAYVPIAGTAGDSLRARAELVSRLHWSTYDKGRYSAVSMLDTINQAAVARGAIFQPAFEINYLPRTAEESTRRPLSPGLVTTPLLLDPTSAKADLAVLVSSGPIPILQVSARKPVHLHRDSDVLADELLRVLTMLCTTPDRSVTAIPAEAFPSTRKLVTGHHSGVALDPVCAKALITSVPGIRSCRMEVTADGQLRAGVMADEPMDVTELRRILRQRQPWWSGSVVPDDLVVTAELGHSSTKTIDASS